jgi:putative inorganic carbon (hco3(-)) transporter
MTTFTQLQIRKGIPFLFGILAIAFGVAVGFYAGNTPKLIEALAIIIGILIMILIFSDLDFGLVILIAMNYLRISQIGINYYGAPPTALPLTILLLLAIAVRWILTKEAPRRWLAGSILIGVYGLVVFMSMFVAEDYAQAIDALLVFLGDAVVATTIMMMMQKASSLRGVVWALIACGIFIGSINVFQFVTRTFDNYYFGFAQAGNVMQIVGSYSDYRLGGPIGDPNYFAEILILVIPLAFQQILAEKSIIYRSLAAYSAFICSLALILTYSRGGFLALMIVAGAALILRAPKIGQVLLIISFVIIIFGYIPTKYTDRILTVVDLATNKIDPREEGSFRGRTGAMLTAWNMFLDHPFFGVGINNYPKNYAKYSSSLGIVDTTEVVHPHNLYLEIMAETGLAGIGTFGMILLAVYAGIRNALRIFKRLGRTDLINSTLGISLGLLGYFISAFFIHGSYPRYLWMMIGIGLSLPIVAYNLYNEQISEENE